MKTSFKLSIRDNERSNKVEKILSHILVNQGNFEKDIDEIKRDLQQLMKKDRARELHEIKSTLTDDTM